jgi:predicted transcriptional regulator
MIMEDMSAIAVTLPADPELLASRLAELADSIERVRSLIAAARAI